MNYCESWFMVITSYKDSIVAIVHIQNNIILTCTVVHVYTHMYKPQNTHAWVRTKTFYHTSYIVGVYYFMTAYVKKQPNVQYITNSILLFNKTVQYSMV